MKAIKIIVLILLSVVFIAYGMGFMVYRGVDKTVLDQQYYRSVVDDQGIPAIVHGEIGKMIPEVVRNGLTGGSPVTDPNKKAAVDAQVNLISTAIIDALDEQWIGEQTVMVTDDVANVLSGEKPSLSAVVDLTGKLDTIEQNIAEGLDVYSDAELMAMFGAPRAYIPTIAEQIVGQLGLPQKLVIADLVNDMAPGTLEMISGYLGTMGSVFGILLLLVVTIVFLVCCVLFLKIGGGLQWFGITAALSGGIFLIVIGYFSNLSRIEGLAGADLSSLPIQSSVVENIVEFTFSKMNTMPIIFLVGGIVLFVIGLVAKGRNKVA